MQRPSVIVGLPETSTSYLSKPSPRHVPAGGYTASEIVEEQQEVTHSKAGVKRSLWSLKPEETVHLIPVTLVLCCLILSLPTCYNAYWGLPLGTTHRFGGSSVVQMHTMTSGDAILIHPELGRGNVGDDRYTALKSEVEFELKKKRRVRSAGLGAFFRSAKGVHSDDEGFESDLVGEDTKADVGSEHGKAHKTKKDKKKAGRHEKKVGKKGDGKKKGGSVAEEGHVAS